MTGLKGSFKETLQSIGPVVIIILLIQAIFAPMPAELMVRFLIGSTLLIIGLSIFNLGVSVGMEPMGSEIGSGMAKSRKLWVIVFCAFAIGFIVTLTEPDLQVLIGQVDKVSGGTISPNTLLISIAAGVGVMLVVALLRIVFQWPYRYLLRVFVVIIFALAALVPPEFVPIAFDSGGVTTGPMTVPFVLAIGIGVSSIRNDKNAEEDSFGLVGLVSLGPVLCVLILGVLSR